MGDTAGAVERKLGQAAYVDGFFTGRERTFRGPIAIPAPDGIQAAVLRYRDFAFLVGSIGVYSMKTTAKGAETERGIGVGDSLASARRRYAVVECGRFSSGEGNAFDWCRARVSDNAVFFGGDPVETITVTRVARFPRKPSSRFVYPRRGAYRGIAIGATRREVVARLGSVPRWDPNRHPILPLVRATRGTTIPPFAAIRPVEALRYPDVVYLLGQGRVYAIVVSGNAGGPPPEGIAVMARLATAKRLFPSLRCGTRTRGDGELRYRFCAGRVAPRRWLWVADDPIQTIVVARVALRRRR